MDVVNDFESLATARLLDFFGSGTRWYRSLWNPGLILSLREILEASHAVQTSILSESALTFAVSSVLRTAPFDSGVGDRTRLKALQEALSTKLRFGGLDYLAAKQLTEEIESKYLSHWAAHLMKPSNPNPERVARAIAAHLLDLGFNSDYLHRWWTYRLHYEQPRRSLHEIIMEAHALASTPLRPFTVLVAFESVPPRKFGRPGGWTDAPAVSQWLQANGFDNSGVRQRGGVLLQVEARDGRAAADAAAEEVENLAARARVATANELRYLPQVWVAGEPAPYSIGQRSRGLNVGALIRENVVYTKAGTEEAVDAAFEMLAPLQASSPIAAIAAGWAAVEALLSEPNDRGGAADRLASIVACSLPRAELTVLSYVLEKQDADMAAALANITENRDRAAVVARAILAGQPLSLTGWADKAALWRMMRLLHRPGEVLEDIRSYATATFRRLYRQRNLVLHGGRTNPVALRACLRTAAPLVGAGMDRIAHSYYVNKRHPLATAAQARIAITTIAGQDPLHCVDLLS
ncbi:MAG: hypothetical protein QOI11_3234 [Candidatus Eremiobacteraeota bacterium]|nr:hypothetical protein [Candidatus Eremiobacteraeota bacterium]